MHDDDRPWPVSWDECQDFIDRPRMRNESASEYAARRAIGRLSRQIRESLQVERSRMRFE